MTTELSPKRLELLKGAVPKASRVVFLHDPEDAPAGSSSRRTPLPASVSGYRLRNSRTGPTSPTRWRPSRAPTRCISPRSHLEFGTRPDRRVRLETPPAEHARDPRVRRGKRLDVVRCEHPRDVQDHGRAGRANSGRRTPR